MLLIGRNLPLFPYLFLRSEHPGKTFGFLLDFTWQPSHHTLLVEAQRGGLSDGQSDRAFSLKLRVEDMTLFFEIEDLVDNMSLYLFFIGKVANQGGIENGPFVKYLSGSIKIVG